MFSFVLLVVVIYAAVTIIFYTLRNGISPMPTGGRVNRVVLDVLHEINPTGRIVELGSGWGTLALRIGKRLPQCLKITASMLSTAVTLTPMSVPGMLTAIMERLIPSTRLLRRYLMSKVNQR